MLKYALVTDDIDRARQLTEADIDALWSKFHTQITIPCELRHIDITFDEFQRQRSIHGDDVIAQVLVFSQQMQIAFSTVLQYAYAIQLAMSLEKAQNAMKAFNAIGEVIKTDYSEAQHAAATIEMPRNRSERRRAKHKKHKSDEQWTQKYPTYRSMRCRR